MSTTSSTAHLRVPLAGAGLLMAGYLLVRPYGDTGNPTSLQAAAAFADGRWVVAHLLGVLGIAAIARIALRFHDIAPGPLTRLARWAGLAGLVFTLPYYGAETFGLHALGRAALDGDPGVLTLVDAIRNQPVALTMFGVGLLLLAVSGVAAALGWQRAFASPAAWPLGVLIALILPQFYLPPTGRMAFGVLFLGAAAWWLAATRRAQPSATAVTPERGSADRPRSDARSRA